MAHGSTMETEPKCCCCGNCYHIQKYITTVYGFQKQTTTNL